MLLRRYASWLHGRWPAGEVERLPEVGPDGETAVAGLRIVGDLTGIPLLKMSAHTGARAVRAFAAEPSFEARKGTDGVVDVAVVGAGVSGVSAAMEAKALGLSCVVFEAAEPFATIAGFPKAKPIYTYPTDMRPDGQLTVSADVKEALQAELEAQRRRAGIEITRARVDRVEREGNVLAVRHGDGGAETTRAHRVVVAIGRTGNHREIGVPGEDLDKVYHRLYDPADHAAERAVVVGGGDSAVETAVALADAGAEVTLVHRGPTLSRPKPENVAKLESLANAPKGAAKGSLALRLGTTVKEITPRSVVLAEDGTETTLDNDVVFAMIGREAPLDFFRRSGVPIVGEWRRATWISFVAFLAFCLWLYHWKSYGWTTEIVDPEAWVALASGWLGGAADDSTSLIYTVLASASGPSFYYTLAYSALVVAFGVRRIRKRRTPYVKAQTVTLMLVQVVPLFVLPEVVLPWMGRNGMFLEGAPLRGLADVLFETYDGGVGVERAYWRAYGFVLAWPLMVYNWFTSQPMWGWLVVGGLQTFVILPLIIRRWGKGAYCGWICSCGALAETLGDTQRHKMPHGPRYNRLNLVGQGVLAIAVALMAVRVWGWIDPASWAAASFDALVQGSSPLTYKWIVDVMLAGVVGVGCYFWLSGRVWCRFACPLAALMHVYARASRFRIFADKKKCISCNVCTSVCHQGIDVMGFANKGLPMEDPQCVRCSACVQSCPTGVLTFGRIGPDGAPVHDRLAASSVQTSETGRRLPVVG